MSDVQANPQQGGDTENSKDVPRLTAADLHALLAQHIGLIRGSCDFTDIEVLGAAEMLIIQARVSLINSINAQAAQQKAQQS